MVWYGMVWVGLERGLISESFIWGVGDGDDDDDDDECQVIHGPRLIN